MKLRRVVAWLLCSAPMVLAADSSAPPGSTRPDTAARQAEVGSNDETASSPAQDREWQRVERWMQEHCPHRVAFLELMPLPSRREQARRMMIDRYNQIQRVQFPPLREAFIQELEAQDQIFGAQLAMRRAMRRRDPAMQSTADADLRAAVGRLFDAQQARRRARIDQLAQESKRITDEMERQDGLRDQLLNDWFNNMKNNAARMPAGRPQHPAHEAATRPSDEQ